MHGLILAAGRGTRMKALTDDRPKCLVELAGKSLLQWQLGALSQAGIEPIVVVNGYLGERLCGAEYRTLTNPRWMDTNMVRSLACARALLSRKPVIVSYSDIVYRSDWVRYLMKAEGDIVISYDRLWKSLWRIRFVDPLSDAETFSQSNGLLNEIGRRTDNPDEIRGQYMGLLKLTPDGWRTIEEILNDLPSEEVDALDMTSLLRILLARRKKVHAIPIDGGWCEIDSEDDLAAYNQMITRADTDNRRWNHDWRR